MFLYYYIDTRCAIDDIDQEHIKLSRLGCVNDPNEWLPRFVSKNDGEVPIGYAKDFVEKHWGSRYGFVSLSKSWRIASMWGNYADRYRGVVLEIECINPDLIIPITYAKSRPTFTGEMTEENFRALCATKSQDWSYEQEVRYLHPLDVDNCQYKNGLCFEPMQVISPSCKGIVRLNRVICGPFISRVNEMELRQLCAEYDGHRKIPIVNTIFDQETYSFIPSEQMEVLGA